MSLKQVPQKQKPNPEWQHYDLWLRVEKLIYALPNYFESEINIKGINVTDLYSVGNLFSTVIESNLVSILNKLRTVWDVNNSYSNYAFQRQAQTFPDVLLKNLNDKEDIIFGIELKAWYTLSKEGEPSFRFTIDPEACANSDILVVVPWLLSEVISGKPVLLLPYVEMAKYAAECRNYYWQEYRSIENKNPNINRPDAQNRHPYPKTKKDASDKSQDDKGSNFGRIARAGQGNLLEEYLNEIKSMDYLGIKIRHWIKIFKAISEGSTEEEIDIKLDKILDEI